MATFTRRQLVQCFIVAAIPVPAWALTKITVHKDPSCDCCGGWVEHLRAAGFAADVVETHEINRVKSRLGIPSDLAACHTGEAEGYLFEGHVPAVVIRQFLLERPNAKGLAVPGMPSGSPGMGGDPEQYDVVLFGPNERRVYARCKGDQLI